MMLLRKNQFKDLLNRSQIKQPNILKLESVIVEYLDLFKSLGCGTAGIEGSPENAKKGRQKEQSIENNFLEQLPDPRLSLSIAKSFIKNDGLVLLKALKFALIIDKLLFNNFSPDHLFYYTKQTFYLLLDLYGFEVIEITNIKDDYIISALERPKDNINFNLFEKQRLSLNNEIENFFLKSFKKHSFFWGSGRQIMTITSSLNVEHLTSYIIDSVKFKQNKYGFVSGKKILSPNKILKLQPEKITFGRSRLYFRNKQNHKK